MLLHVWVLVVGCSGPLRRLHFAALRSRGYLYGTKVMVDSLLKDTQTPCAAAKVLCPSLEKLQPCMDDWKCSEIMRRDYGGQTMLSWRDLCRARPQDQMELEAQQIGDNWGVDESGWGSAMDQQGGATQGFK